MIFFKFGWNIRSFDPDQDQYSLSKGASACAASDEYNIVRAGGGLIKPSSCKNNGYGIRYDPPNLVIPWKVPCSKAGTGLLVYHPVPVIPLYLPVPFVTLVFASDGPPKVPVADALKVIVSPSASREVQ